MSKATKRKYVAQEVLDDFNLPTEHQTIVKVVGSRGNNLHEVETPTGEKYLASMPSKYRKNVWIKRGDFLIVDPISEGDKVRGEIVNILYKEQIKYIQEEGKWPAEFRSQQRADHGDNKSTIPDDMLPPSGDSDSDETANTIVNPNRPQFTYYHHSDSEDNENDDQI